MSHPVTLAELRAHVRRVASAPSAALTPAHESAASRLVRLSHLREEGLISDELFVELLNAPQSSRPPAREGDHMNCHHNMPLNIWCQSCASEGNSARRPPDEIRVRGAVPVKEEPRGLASYKALARDMEGGSIGCDATAERSIVKDCVVTRDRSAPPPSTAVRAWRCADCQQTMTIINEQGTPMAKQLYCTSCKYHSLHELPEASLASLDLVPRASVLDFDMEARASGYVPEEAVKRAAPVSCNHNLSEYVHRDELTAAKEEAARCKRFASTEMARAQACADGVGLKDAEIAQLRAEVGRLALEARRGRR